MMYYTQKKEQLMYLILASNQLAQRSCKEPGYSCKKCWCFFVFTLFLQKVNNFVPLLTTCLGFPREEPEHYLIYGASNCGRMVQWLAL